MSAENRIERARLLYERAVFDGDTGALATADSELDGVEADLALARGRVIHTRFLGQLDEDPERAMEDPRELALFERAARLYRERADVRGEAEALFWIGCFHQVVRRDDQTAVPTLERSRELAAQVGDKSTMSEALRHLGIAEHRAGHLDGARERLEESTRLRREIGLMPGVAANLVGQAYIAAADDRRDYARTLLAEAAAIAEATGAHRISRQVDEARADLKLPEPGDSADEGHQVFVLNPAGKRPSGLSPIVGGDEGQAGDALVGPIAVGDAVDQDHIHLEVVGAQVGDLLVGGGFVPAPGAPVVGELDHDDAHAPRPLQNLRRGVMDPESAAERVQGVVDPPQVLGDLQAGVDEAANVGDDESGHCVIPFGGCQWRVLTDQNATAALGSRNQSSIGNYASAAVGRPRGEKKRRKKIGDPVPGGTQIASR
jgi:hypothetical protein